MLQNWVVLSGVFGFSVIGPPIKSRKIWEVLVGRRRYCKQQAAEAKQLIILREENNETVYRMGSSAGSKG